MSGRSAYLPPIPAASTTKKLGGVTDTAQKVKGAKRGEVTSLASDGGEVLWNLASNNFFKCYVDEETVLIPTNVVEGQSGVLVITAENGEQPINFDSSVRFLDGHQPVGGPDGTINMVSYFVVDLGDGPEVFISSARVTP